MPGTDELVGKWAQERLFHGPIAVNSSVAKQVWDAVTDFRKDFSPKTAAEATAAVDKMVTDKFMNAPPLTHDTPAVNQLSAAIANLKERLTEALKEPAPKAPPPPPPPKAKDNTEPKE